MCSWHLRTTQANVQRPASIRFITAFKHLRQAPLHIDHHLTPSTVTLALYKTYNLKLPQRGSSMEGSLVKVGNLEIFNTVSESMLGAVPCTKDSGSILERGPDTNTCELVLLPSSLFAPTASAVMKLPVITLPAYTNACCPLK